MTNRLRTGFSLIEVAIVLVIIGLLLVGVFRGQELIVAARVRSLVQQQDEVKTAYLAFYDRFRALPGDYLNATTTIPGISLTCGSGANRGNGNGNNQIELVDGEAILAWEHLSKSGFLKGVYTCIDNVTVAEGAVPRNAYGGFAQLVFDANFAGTARDQHNLKTGANLPSNVLAELDRKVDDGLATAGGFLGSTYSTGTPTDGGCWDATGQWSFDPVFPNCGAASLL